MRKYKALIIENDFDETSRVRKFTEANKDIFEEVTLFSHARHKQKLLIDAIFSNKYDAFIIDSTFTHKDQLKSLLEVFKKADKISMKFCFFIVNFMYKIDQLPLEDCKEWIAERRIFSISENDYQAVTEEMLNE